ncbi:MAG: tetratricopeptide repeat protein, partial [Candidatus Omnitrophica bacterium]|nr:tetratricopeptide repeat protein [Candidatus Omnitrophota bacterium]
VVDKIALASQEEKVRIGEAFAKDSRYKFAAECLKGAIKASEYFKTNKNIFEIPQLSPKDLVEESLKLNKEEKNTGSNKLDYRLGVFNYNIEDYDKAILYFNKVLKDNPKSLDIKYKLANIFYKKGEFAAAYRLFKEIYEAT